MAQEVCLLRAFAPEVDGKRQRVDRLPVATDEGTTKVYPLQIVLLGLEVCDLSNVVAANPSAICMCMC